MHCATLAATSGRSMIALGSSRMVGFFLITVRMGCMAKTPKSKKVAEIEDEPGAEERFKQIVKRALTTPPRKYTGEPKSKRKGGAKKRSK